MESGEYMSSAPYRAPSLQLWELLRRDLLLRPEQYYQFFGDSLRSYNCIKFPRRFRGQCQLHRGSNNSFFGGNSKVVRNFTEKWEKLRFWKLDLTRLSPTYRLTFRSEDLGDYSEDGLSQYMPQC